MQAAGLLFLLLLLDTFSTVYLSYIVLVCCLKSLLSDVYSYRETAFVSCFKHGCIVKNVKTWLVPWITEVYANLCSLSLCFKMSFFISASLFHFESICYLILREMSCVVQYHPTRWQHMLRKWSYCVQIPLRWQYKTQACFFMADVKTNRTCK